MVNVQRMQYMERILYPHQSRKVHNDRSSNNPCAWNRMVIAPEKIMLSLPHLFWRLNCHICGHCVAMYFVQHVGIGSQRGQA
jgi:hypothetical protein